jgi:dephospho-CoA kinase
VTATDATPHALQPGAPAGRGLHIGLTGGIGSGKSTVARRLVELGAVLVDTDAIARALTAPGGAALPTIAQDFGPQAIGADGAMDRDWMRARAFADPAVKARLEAILHPLIGTTARAQAAAAGGRTVVFDVPLLAESGHWRARVDRVLVIDCGEQTQVQRVMARNSWPEEAVRRVIAQQATREQRRAIADAVILNDGISLVQLQAEVDRVWDRWHGGDSSASGGGLTAAL